MSSPTLLRRGILVLVVAGAAFAAGSLHPDELEDLDRASRAGAEVQRSSEELADDLARVAENIGRGAGLGKRSHDISELTLKQRASLLRVNRIVTRQYDTLSSALGLVSRMGSASHAIEAASDLQAIRLRETLRSLRELRRLARSAREASEALADEARYGALLAEDSARAFSSR
ncbi:MAG: hypothetical protein QOI31_2103 [Solirubrobacterales bacterium]|jgi:hypothetical protein|nr:hypothetical protein [Solirubrobacterales bacterium]